MTRFIPLAGAAIPGVLAFFVFVVALINGIGQVQAHVESVQFHSAQRCAAEQVDQSRDCVEVVPVSIEGYLGSTAIVLNVPGEGIVPVPIGDVKAIPADRVPPPHPIAAVWHGEVMEVDEDDQEIISANSPDLFTPTWPILAPFGAVIALFAAVVFVLLSWATGDLILSFRRHR